MTEQGTSGPLLPSFFELSAYQSLDSTSTEARRLADLGAAEGQIVWALKQESGVGRRGRHWSSPAGNLYCSLLLRPSCSAAEGAKLSFLIAVALYDALEQVLPPDAPISLKWPNDVLLGGRKVAGILLESKSNVAGQLEWLIVGTGVNVATYPKKTDGLPATCLKEAGANVSLEALLNRYAGHVLDLYRLWQEQGFAPVRDKWLMRAGGLGGPVTARLGGQEFKGIFKEIDPDGALVLVLADGSIKRVTAGEVFYNP